MSVKLPMGGTDGQKNTRKDQEPGQQRNCSLLTLNSALPYKNVFSYKVFALFISNVQDVWEHVHVGMCACVFTYKGQRRLCPDQSLRPLPFESGSLTESGTRLVASKLLQVVLCSAHPSVDITCVWDQSQIFMLTQQVLQLLRPSDIVFRENFRDLYELR